VRRRILVTGFSVSAFLFLMLAPLFAHHGNAVFDESKYVSVKAIVTEWIWANPHCFLKFDVKDDKGNVSHWIAETSNPPDMLNRGWSKQMFKVGDEVTVIMMTVKNGQPRGRIRDVVLSTGQTLSNEGGLNPATPINALK
jgi:Family of unknown function (DUF6152)